MRRSVCLVSAFLVVAGLMVANPCQAALFSGPSGFTNLPTSQLGAVTNNLVLTDTATGFVVSGQVLISVPAGSVAGTLATWTVDRPLDSSYGTSSMITTTELDGFSQPPIGAFGTTSGVVASTFTNFPNLSYSSIPMLLTGGAATWTKLSVSSAPFVYTSGGVNFLHQVFQLDGVQLAGPGGTWIVDVPVTTTATVVPEPSTLVLGAAGFLGLLGWRQSRRRRAPHGATSVANRRE